jgi:hypothetical protein
VKKGEERGIPSTQVIIAVLNEEKEIGLTKIKGTSYFENLSVFVRTNSTNRIANVLEIQSDPKSCSFGGNAKW